MSNKIKVPLDLKREDILALDIATHCGYCTHNHNGTWNFEECKHNNFAEHKDFRDTLIKFIKENDVRLVTAEDVNVSKFFGSMRKLSEFRGILIEVCDELLLPEPIFINVTSIKKFATGNGSAKKEQMIDAMIKQYNKTPCDDNACDAFWIYTLICKRYRI